MEDRKIKRENKKETQVYRDYVKNGQTEADYMYVRHAITEVSQLILESKDNYYNKLAIKLNNPKIISKTYWSIIKTFCNGRKIPIIPPIVRDGKLEFDLKTKANYFNKFFASQCCPLDKITYKSAARLTSINFDNNDVLTIIRSLNVNKAHGKDSILVRMLKMCDKSLVQPLTLIFKGCIDTGVYPDT